MGTNRDEEDSVPLIGGEESAADYKARWRSIRVVYLTMFMSSLGFSIVLSTIWPFLKNVGGSKPFLGWVVAAFSVGQLLGSPLFGWLGTRRCTLSLIVSLVINVGGNVMYCFTAAVPDHNNWFMLVARFLVGFGAGNIAVCRGYLAGATTIHERTGAITVMSAMQGTGFIIGPLLGAAFRPMKYWKSGAFEFDLYTGPGYLSVLFGILNIVAIVLLFREFRVDKAVDEGKNVQDDDDGIEDFSSSKYKRDIPAVASCLWIFFAILFVFSVFETVGTGLITMDEYGWDDGQADEYNGFTFGAAGVLAVIVFIGAKKLAPKFGERQLLIVGLVLILVGYIMYLPWGPLPYTPHCRAPKDPWCDTTPELPLAQFLVASFFVALGYPASSVMIYSIYSKVLGPAPQGVMMGVLSSTGSLARILGPIVVGNLYQYYGPRILYGSVGALILVTIIFNGIMYKKLVPHPLYRLTTDTTAKS